MQCKSGDAADCLTKRQVDSVRSIYAHTKTPDGRTIHGFPVGHEGGPTDPTNPDLTAFKQRRDKLLKCHLAGPAISPYGTIEQVVAKTGSQQQADEFVRLAPGMHHIIAAAARVRTISTA